MSTWETLGIAATAQEGAIRRAYAARVRQWRTDTHPQEFARLREAYEHALRWARSAVEEAGDVAQSEGATAGADAPQAAHAREAGEAGEARQARDADAPVRLPQPSHADADLPLPPAAPSADAMIHELAQCFSSQGEIAAIGLLRQQYALVNAHTIDARLDWEQVLLGAVLGAETPPLSLVFEGDRLLEWRERHADVMQMFGHEEAERLRVLLDLAHETTYLRFFSPNRWQRRIFGAARLPWVGMTVQVEAARHSVQWWRKLAQAARRESLQELLDARVLRRLEGLLVMSTDVLLAMVLAWICWPVLDALASAQQPWVGLALTAGVFALAMPLPLLGRRLWDTPAGQRLRGWRDTLQRQPFAGRAIALGAILAACITALASEAPLPVRIAGGAILATIGAAIVVMVLVGVWCVLRFFEQLVSLPWLWLQRTWGLHAFQGVVAGRGAPTWRDQLRGIFWAVVALHAVGRLAK